MQAEQLIHHTKENGYASYGRRGETGNDILVAPSVGPDADRRFIGQIENPETTVVALLDDGPTAEVQAALKTLMPVWNTARRGNVYIAHDACSLGTLHNGFMDAVRMAYVRERLPIDPLQEAAMEIIERDLRTNTALFENVVDGNSPIKFRMMYYPPASLPISIFHNWHADTFPETIIGKMRLQRSLNVQGLSFAFKEQASPDIKAGIGLSTGCAVFKTTPENIHKAAPISPTEGRMIYTLTAEPSRPYFAH